MKNTGAEIYDEMPDRCPGCGKFDTPLADGPSSLMLLWSPLLDSYICIDCNRTYTEWVNWAPEYRERNKPLTITNIEKVVAGEEPSYSHWASNPPMGAGYIPHT